MNIDNPSSPGGGQPPKKIEAYQCNLCPAVFGFKFNAKRHFQKLHPEDQYDGSKITNIKFKCYLCQWGFDTYGNLESHFAQVHQGQILNPEKVYLGDTQTTAATFQSVKRMKTPSKRKKTSAAAASVTAESHTSRPSSVAASHPPPATQQTSQFYGLQHRHNGAEQLPPAHVMMAPGHPDRSQSTTMSYQGDLLCNACDFTSDNPQSLALHQQTCINIQTHFNSNGMSPMAQPSQHPTPQPPPPSQQQHYYNAAHQHQQHDPFIDFKAEEQQYQQHMYQQSYQPPYHHGYQQQGYHHYPQSHHQMYNNQIPQQYQNYHHYPPPPHPPPPPPHHTPSAVTNQAPSPSPLTPPHPQQIQYPAAPVPPSHHQQPPQYHEVPHYQSQHQEQQPHSMIANSSTTTYSEQQPPQHLTEVKSEPNEALIDRQQNGNAVTGAAGGGSDSSSASPHHHQQGDRNSPYHGLQPPHNLQEYSPASRSNGSEASKVMSTAAVAKQRRTNIGKMFQTHICFVCDSKLAKLDCIKMHFKNKHPETALDLNQVLISRVVCYICGVRKKEYAILVRHFQVEHKDQDIDPYRIGMDEPSPFNLSPEEETDLNKLPIPQPVKHDLNSSNRKILSTTPASKSSFSSNCNLDITNDNTMDSIEDEQYQLPINIGGNSIEHGQNIGSRGGESVLTSSNHHQSSIPMSTQSPPRKKPRTVKRAFKNNKCRTCGKAFSRITTVKKHFLDHHPDEVFDRATKVEVIKLPCYLCDTMITDARHALRHFESAHPGQEFDANQVHISGVEFTNGANEEEDMEDSFDSGSRLQLDQDDDQGNDGFRCYLCNYWCSKIEDFQAHFAPETKAHENVSEVTIICPVCMHKCQTTEEMFDHVTKEHGGGAASTTCTEDDASISSSSLSIKEEMPPSEAPPSQTPVNNATTNCVETC